jgi:hypothetical protein
MADDIISCIMTSGEATDVKISGNYAYVADGNSGLGVVEIYLR